jgi:hypothetical protein
LSLLVVIAIVLFVFVANISLKGVAIPDLIIGLALVGASSVTSAWVGVHAIILRLLGWQAKVTVGRAMVALLTLSSFAAAYYWFGVDPSLVFGFATLTLASPLVFSYLTRQLYRSSPPVLATALDSQSTSGGRTNAH